MIKYYKCIRHCDPDKVGRSNLIIFTGLLRHFVPRNNRIGLIIILFLIFSFLSLGELYAQSTRGLINDGVDYYDDSKFSDAEVNFKKGAEQSPESFEAKFNLGDAYYKQERYNESIKSFQSAFANAKTDEEKAKLHYNVGNSLLKSQKLDESIEAYKESLKLNPNDPEAKYNLSYALNMKNNQEQNQQNQDQQQDQNKNEDQQNDNQNQDQQDKEQENKDQQQQDQQNQESQQDNTKQQQQEQKISKEEAERILEALKDNEKDLQKELRRIKGKRVKTEKDW
jgi:tetratricopeptide (TPR) repeat protein